MSVEILAGAGALIVGLITWLVSKSRKQGRAEILGEATAQAQKKVDEVVLADAERQVKQVEEVNEIHDRLQSDPAYAQRVRDRFSRD